MPPSILSGPELPPDIAVNYTRQERRGFVTDQGWPFRLDVSVEYQAWIIVAICFFLALMWCSPCICSKLHNSCSKKFMNWVYTRLHVFYWGVLYITLFVVMFTIGVLPDWTVDEFVDYLIQFTEWILLHLQKAITCISILFAFWVMLKFRERITFLAGMEHITVFRFNLFKALGFTSKQRPVELFIWKIEKLQSSSAKLFKANDVYVEVHLGYNEPMRTRVHNNAGTGCVVRESLQFNVDEAYPSEQLTLLVRDQGIVGSGELGRLTLTTREILGIEDQTGKRRSYFEYAEENFVPLGLTPAGTIWIALAPVEEWDDSERAFLINDDSLLPTC